MQADETLKILVDKFNLDLSQPNPIQIPGSRWHDVGQLLNDLGFKNLAEIGVYRGRFTERLTSQCPTAQVSAIDAWNLYQDYNDYTKDDLEDIAYNEFNKRMEKYNNLKVIKSWSVDASKIFEDNSLDYIFIDANHQFEFVVEDLKAWYPKVKEGGIIMGHDYFAPRHPKIKVLNFGVINAVNGFVESKHIKHLFIWKDNVPSWLFVKGDNL